ncbi:MAG: hypothetical protein D6726_01895 [Nitrospirae bacterium]|nr:MAG: hypothetical protein D6726_01895 [Nitrospirota bacterium]
MPDHRKRVGRWIENLNPEEAVRIQEILSPQLEKLGYQLLGVDEIKRRSIELRDGGRQKISHLSSITTNQKVCCVAGMHRSGTSMVARMLNICGVYLGRSQDLMPPAESNPTGFWENVAFQSINDDILRSFNGCWYAPPARIDVGELLGGRFGHITEKAMLLIESFKEQKVWGWKDPRNSITLPYWSTLVPEVKVIVPVRNPLDVALSLKNRDDIPLTHSLKLWCIYNRAVIENIHKSRRLFVHYERFFSEPELELRKMTEFLGLEVNEKDIQKACKTVNFRYTHTISGLSDLEILSFAGEARELYLEICRSTGYDPEKETVCLPGDLPASLEVISTKEVEKKLLLMEIDSRVNELMQIRMETKNISDRIEKLAQKTRNAEDTLNELRKGLSGLRSYDLPAGACILLGELCIKAALTEEARWYFEKAIQEKGYEVEGLNNMGVLSFLEGDLDRARRCFQMALEKEPENTEARLNLLKLGEMMGAK